LRARVRVAGARSVHARSSARPNKDRLGRAEGALRHPVAPVTLPSQVRRGKDGEPFGFASLDLAASP